MATTSDFYDYIMDNLTKAGGVTSRKMMGEYCIYYQGKLVGDICDNCFLIKRTPSSDRLLPNAEPAYPYEGSKTLMLPVDDVENTEFITELLKSVYSELPESEKRQRKEELSTSEEG